MLSALRHVEDSRAFFLRGGFDYNPEALCRQDEIQIVLERLFARLGSKDGKNLFKTARRHKPGVQHPYVPYVTENFGKRLTLEALASSLT
jgi:hypothetical protein